MRIKILSVLVVAAAIVALALGPLAAAKGTNLQLDPGPFAPDSTGRIQFAAESGVLSGNLKAENLPALGLHAFYVLWFVRMDTGDKAFLGPVVNEGSIFFTTSGEGKMRFSAPAFTDGPGKGSPISIGSPGNNFFVLIAENNIDTFAPHPISEPPSSFALMATF